MRTLAELKAEVDAAIEKAAEFGESPNKIPISLQIDLGNESVWTNSEVADIELHYDNDLQASGCVILGTIGTREDNVGSVQAPIKTKADFINSITPSIHEFFNNTGVMITNVTIDAGIRTNVKNRIETDELIIMGVELSMK